MCIMQHCTPRGVSKPSSYFITILAPFPAHITPQNVKIPELHAISQAMKRVMHCSSCAFYWILNQLQSLQRIVTRRGISLHWRQSIYNVILHHQSPNPPPSIPKSSTINPLILHHQSPKLILVMITALSHDRIKEIPAAGPTSCNFMCSD